MWVWVREERAGWVSSYRHPPVSERDVRLAKMIMTVRNFIMGESHPIIVWSIVDCMYVRAHNLYSLCRHPVDKATPL